MRAGDVVRRAAAGAGHLFVLQGVTRVVTFLMNVAIVRGLQSCVSGAYSIPLQLFLTVTLSLCREGVRRASLSRSSTPREASSLSLWCVPAGIVVLPIACLLAAEGYHPNAGSESRCLSEEAWKASVWIFGLAALVELCSEPFAAAALQAQRYRPKLVVESVAAVVRCVASFVLVRVTPGFVNPLVALSVGQLAFAVALVVGYWSIREAGDALSLSRPGEEVVKATAVFTWQTAQKLALGEGEKFVLMASESLVKQGAYSVANNLGSMAARTLLQPIEEVSFTAFGKLSRLRRQDGSDADRTERVAVVRLCDKALATVVRLTCFVGLVSASFGPAFSELGIRLLYGSKYADTEAPQILRWFSLYVLFMAVNGVTEAFVHSAASEKQLVRLNMWLVAFSAVFVTSATLGLRFSFGTVSLVWANILNMSLRIWVNWRFIRSWMSEGSKGAVSLSLRSWLPSTSLLALFLFILLSSTLARLFLPPLPHLLLGLLLFSLLSFFSLRPTSSFRLDLTRLRTGAFA